MGNLMSSVTYYPGYSQTQVTENLICRNIISITNSYPAILTTDVDHKYTAGMMVTFLIPPSFGMVELNGQNVQVLSVTSNTLNLNVDTSNYMAFAYPSPLPDAYTPPSVVPNSSGPYLQPLPLPYGNQDSFEGVIYNNGMPSDPINGLP
jgi:hypothetical protein